jgi:hypothetical protein
MTGKGKGKETSSIADHPSQGSNSSSSSSSSSLFLLLAAAAAAEDHAEQQPFRITSTAPTFMASRDLQSAAKGVCVYFTLRRM